MAKTFTRSSIAYSDSGTLLAADTPDASTRYKVTNFTLTRPTGQGDASEDIAPLGGVDDEIVVGVGSTSRNLFYTTDGETWTKWASPADAYQAFVYKSGSQYNAYTLEGVLATGLEVHHWTDITGTPTDTRVKMGGSTATTSEAYDKENNNLLANGGDCTPGASGTTGGGDATNGWMHEADEIPLPSTAWTVSLKFNRASIVGTETIWACCWSSAPNRVGLQFINSSGGSLRLQVESDANVINLNNSAAGYVDGTTYRVDLTYDGSSGWTLATYTDAGTLIESGTATASWSPGTTDNGEFTLFGRADSVTAARCQATLSEVKIYDGATLIRDWPLTSDYAVVDGSLPATANWQDQAVDHSSGTTIFGYYANPGTAVDTYLYRSTDGTHFPLNYTHAVTDSGVNNHIHAVRRLTNFDAWVASFGDQTNKSEVYSTDDGVSWTENVNTDETREQPIGFWDHPNGTDVLVAYDNTTLIGTRQYDGSGNITSRIEADLGVPRYDPDNSSTYNQRYAWLNKPVAGLFWASRSSTNTTERSTLAVSRDAQQYTTIYQMGADEGGIRAIWPIGNYIIGAVVDILNPDKFDRIQVRWDQDAVTAVTTNRVSAGATNLLSEDESTGATTTGSVAATGGSTLAAGTGGQVGDSTITISDSTASNMTLRGPQESTTATENITGIIYIKGNSTELVEAGVWNQTGTATLSKASLCFSDNWIPVVFPTTVMTGTSHRWEVRHAAQAGTETMLAEVDRSALFAGANVVSPHPWVIGGTAQTAEVLSETVTRGASWSETITFWPGTDSLQIIGDVYCFTYYGTSSVASLVWDGANEKWRLDVTGELAVSSAATYFNKNEQVTVTVTVSASGTDFVVVHGDSTYTLNGAAKSDLYDADITFTTGNNAGDEALWASYDLSVERLDPLAQKSRDLGAFYVYPFDEESGPLRDIVSSNDGTASGTPTYRESDQRGLPSAIGFDGSTDYFTLGSNTLNGISAYSVEVVFKKGSDNAGTNRVIIDERDALGDGVFIQLNTNNDLDGRHNAGQCTYSIDDGWHHGIITWDGATLTMYVDGVSVDTAAVATAVATTTAPTVGTRSYSAGLYYDNDISHVAIYPRALTATEVGELYEAGQEGGGRPTRLGDPRFMRRRDPRYLRV